MPTEKTLKEIFEDPDHNLSVKFPHHIDIYEQFFAPFRGKMINVVEVGVSQGGSLQAWSRYFGPAANIVGVDISTGALNPGDPGISVLTGDQSDRAFLRELKNSLKVIDIFIDDGSHNPTEQTITFEEIFDAINPDGGLYICEDLHYSYQDAFHGYTFVIKMKEMIDRMNQAHNNLSFYFFPFMAIVKKGGHDLRSPVHYGGKK